MNRRDFLALSAGSWLSATYRKPAGTIMTINGPITTEQMGRTLIHEHFLVDFVGADKININRWSRDEVVKKVLPYLEEVKQYGVKTIFDCTPAWLGRDVQLLKMLGDRSKVQLVTNTGYYGAVDNKYLPPHAFTESAEQLAERWTQEFDKGISLSKEFEKTGANNRINARFLPAISVALIVILLTPSLRGIDPQNTPSA